MLVKESQIHLHKKISTALNNIYFLTGVINLKEDSLMITEQEEDSVYACNDSKEYITCTQSMLEELVIKEQKQELQQILSADFLREHINREDSVYRFEYQHYMEDKGDYDWCCLNLIWSEDDEQGRTKEIVYAVQDIQAEKDRKQKIYGGTPARGQINEGRQPEDRSSLLMEEEINFFHVLQRLQEKYQGIADSKRQSLNIEFQNLEHHNVYVNNVRFCQIIGNLLKNAIRQAPVGGRVLIFVRELGTICRDFGVFQIRIKDNGGLEQQENEGIEVFFKEDPRLIEWGDSRIYFSMIRDLVHGMNGEIKLQRSPEMGTEVAVTLNLRLAAPLQEQDIQDYLAEKNEAGDIFRILREINVTGKRVLLSEDNEKHRYFIQEILKRTGLHVESAQNGMEAVELYKKRPSGYYDMIFMDIQMPVMNGYDATRLIRSMEKADSAKIPIVAMTANVYPEDIQMSAQAGMNDHIGKPMNPRQLKDIILRWMI